MTKPFTVKATFIRDLPRLLGALIFGVSLSLLPSSALAQSEFVRSIASLQTRDLPTGSIVTITGDAALDGYTAYTSNDHFNVVIPRAVVSTPQKELRGRDFSECLVQQRNNVVLISFQTKPGSTVRVSQNFNRINVIFSSAGVSTTSADSKPSAIESKPEVLRIPKVSKAPTFYDFLVSRPREAEVVVTNFRQYEPGDGTPASQPTKAYLSYDESNLYVVFVCKDDRQKVRAHVARRESISGDDSVSITVDTFQDRRRAYKFAANPLGVQLDGIVTEGQKTDYTWDTLWRSEGRLTADGYIVWMAIPFKSLRFSGAPAQSWGIALGRSIVRNNEQSYWPYITERVQGFVQQLGRLEGLREISPGHNIEIRPYGEFTRSRALETTDSGVNAFRTTNEVRGGLDSKVVLRNALTLDLTVNPDFSQVESDDPQVLVNRRFEVFFPERRPFFVENAGFFQTPEQLFFSRRIIDPQYGARLTGKVGKWAIGALLINDRAKGKLLPKDDPLHDRRASIGVARVQREFAEQSTVGFLVTDYNFANSSNRVYAVDTRFKLNPTWTFTGQIARSYTHDLNGARYSGPVYLADLSRSGRSFNYDLSYRDRSPDFRSRVGFIPRVDTREFLQYASYRWRPRAARVLSLGPTGYVLFNWDHRGKMQNWYANADFAFELPRQTSFKVERSESYELFEEHGFRTHNTAVYFYSSPSDWIELSSSLAAGSAVNYFPPSGLAAFEADSTVATFGFTFRPTSRASFEHTYIYNRLGMRAGFSGLTSRGVSIFNNHIMRSKMNYQFTRELSLRLILDYNGVLPNTSLVQLERFKQLSPDILLTYLVNPGTALYVGYTDRYENLLITPQALSRTGPPTKLTGRQFFVKMSYLFRY